jgi:hypothetical protein
METVLKEGKTQLSRNLLQRLAKMDGKLSYQFINSRYFPREARIKNKLGSFSKSVLDDVSWRL